MTTTQAKKAWEAAADVYYAAERRYELARLDAEAAAKALLDKLDEGAAAAHIAAEDEYAAAGKARLAALETLRRKANEYTKAEKTAQIG